MSAPAIKMRTHLVLAFTIWSIGAVCSSAVHAQSSPSAFTEATRYDALRRVVGTISPDPDGGGPLRYAAVRNTYDAAGRLTQVETGELASWQGETVLPSAWSGFTVFQEVDTTYDGQHRRILEVVSADGIAYAATQYSYDPAGRLLCTARRMNPATYSGLPDACALSSQGSFGPDRITHNAYDNAGQLVVEQRAYLTSLQQDYSAYTYTPNAKPETVTDANGNTSLMSYDGYDRLVQLNFPSKTSPGSWSGTDYEHYSYDDNGNRTTLRKRNGQSISYSYDALNRVTKKDVPGTASDVYYQYDVRGLQLYAHFGSPTGAGINTAYDGFGRPQSSSNDTGGSARTLSYMHDADGNRTRLTFPDGNFFQFSYDGRNRMTSILENGSTSVADLSYNAEGRRSTLDGSVSTNYGYDPISRLASLSHDLVGTTQDVTYTYSSYNPASQLLTQGSNNSSYTFSNAVTATTGYAVNGLNQYTAVSGAAVTYDGNGNLRSHDGTTFSYDIENRLSGATGAVNATLSYDPQGRLFQTTSGASTTQFLYDGDALVAEYDGAGNLKRRYVHGPGVDEPILWYEGSGLNTRHDLRADHQGSVVAVTDANGNSVAINSYDEYGIRGPTNLGRFQYTGQILISELDLYYYKARMYSAALGRFMQTDPIGYEDQLNLYAYVANDPINRFDPTGEYAEAPLEAASMTIGVASAISNAQSGNYAAAAVDVVGVIADGILAAFPGAPGVAGLIIQGVRQGDNVVDATRVPKTPDFVVSPNGTAFPVPKGATGPTPVTNPAGNQTGVAFTGGAGGANGQVTTMRIMNPTPPRGSSPGYPNGYIKYENSALPKPQGVDPYTGKTLPNSQSHFPID